MICFLKKYFKEHPVTGLIAFIISMAIIFGFSFWGISNLSKLHAVKEYTATVKDVQGRRIFLDGGKDVNLIGVWIPDGSFHGHNKAYFLDDAHDIKGKTVRIRSITLAGERYVEVDLVEVLDEKGNLINEKWLKEGKGFFNEDYWNAYSKAKYRKWESEARTSSRGIWSYPDLKVLYVRKRNSNRYHYPDCAKVKNLSERDRYDYFTNKIPVIKEIGSSYLNINESILLDDYCDFCCRRAGNCAKDEEMVSAKGEHWEIVNNKAINETIESFFLAVQNGRLSDVYSKLSSRFKRMFGDSEEVQKKYLKLHMPKYEHPKLRIIIENIKRSKERWRVTCVVYLEGKALVHQEINVVREGLEWKIAEFDGEIRDEERSRGLFFTLVDESGS